MRSALSLLSRSGDGDALWLRRGDSESFAAVVSWAAVRASGHWAVTLENPDTPLRHLALADAGSLDRAGGLLRYSNLIGIVREAGAPAPSPPAGLASGGEIRVHRGGEDKLNIDLFQAAPVDRQGFATGAPVDLQDPEDLDARADWFRKRHDPDQS